MFVFLKLFKVVKTIACLKVIRLCNSMICCGSWDSSTSKAEVIAPPPHWLLSAQKLTQGVTVQSEISTVVLLEHMMVTSHHAN